MADQPAQHWTRETTWRQGQALSTNTVQALGLKNNVTPEATVAIVISHDCDIANDNLQAEPYVEVIVGRTVAKLNGNFAWGKAPRTLHLEMLRDGAPTVIELVATEKYQIAKAELAAFVHDATFQQDNKGLSTLRHWLAVRYHRAAFPDPFVKRMEATKLDEKLANRLKPYTAISTVFFDVDQGQELDRSDGSPYELSIVLAYVPGDDPEVTYEQLEPIEAEIEKLFADKVYDPETETWRDIALRGCVLISEDELTVSQAKLFTQWRLEHMSLRSTDEQATPYSMQG